MVSTGELSILAWTIACFLDNTPCHHNAAAESNQTWSLGFGQCHAIHMEERRYKKCWSLFFHASCHPKQQFALIE